MPAYLYLIIYLSVLAVLCYTISLRYILSPDYSLQTEHNNLLAPFVLSVFFSILLGVRPISYEFTDMNFYASEYELKSFSKLDISFSTEWVWTFLMLFCKFIGFNVHFFFLLIAILYVFTTYFAIKEFTPTNVLIGILFVFSSLVFFNYGTNTIRNGLACHLCLLGIASLFLNKNKEAIIIMILAFGIHRSVILPILAIICGKYIIKNFNIGISIWCISIAVSLLTGNYFSDLIKNFGFDDRISTYLITRDQKNINEYFRWDFLLYSLPPIFLSWYTICKKNIKDEWYKTLSIAYCLCNSVWILLIRASFSDRFAYLSWFMYPVLIAYPLINLPLWKKQDQKIGITLMLYCSFTIFMQVFVW